MKFSGIAGGRSVSSKKNKEYAILIIPQNAGFVKY